MSIEIFDNDKVSFTYEIESDMNDIVLNGSKYDWSEEVVDFEIGVYFDVLKDIGGVEKYAVSSYHLINTNNEGIDIKASFGDIKNHHLLKYDEQKASSAGEITKEWDIVTNANAKLNGKK